MRRQSLRAGGVGGMGCSDSVPRVPVVISPQHRSEEGLPQLERISEDQLDRHADVTFTHKMVLQRALDGQVLPGLGLQAAAVGTVNPQH